MWRPKILSRANRNNPGRVDIVVCEIIMTFDVIEIHRVGNTVELIEIPEIPMQVRVVSDSSNVTLEMAMINGVEPDQGNEEPPVCFER